MISSDSENQALVNMSQVFTFFSSSAILSSVAFFLINLLGLISLFFVERTS
jgi:hypothetical protein